MTERSRIEQAIAALEAQRGALGRQVVETSIASLQKALAALDAPEKRGLLTVLFADISGFTAISDRLDAEDLQDLMRSFWAEIDQTILKYGGEIDKHMGDRLMAVWGATRPYETDARQAVEAALVIQDQVDSFRQKHDAQVHMRIGINSGLASIGFIPSTGERNIVGDTVNVASGLEMNAPDNHILISQSTYARVRGLFDVQSQPPLSLKGREQLITLYSVLAARPSTFETRTRGLAGVAVRTVGREEEIRVLQSAYQQAFLGGGMQWITISGDAGVGKSRLLSDFEKWLGTLPEAPLFLKARAWRETMESPFHLLRSLVLSYAQIGEGDSLADAQEKLTESLTRLLGAETGRDAARLIGLLVGLEQGAADWSSQPQPDLHQVQARSTGLLTHFLETLCHTRPVVILLEDLQWADQHSLELFGDLFSIQRPWRLTVLAAARPPLWDRETRWTQRAHHQILQVDALAGLLARELVLELLQKVTHPPSWLIDLLVEQGGGNPYFTEELVNWLIEQGIIETGETTWQVHLERPWGLTVPGTVQGVLQTRVEQLDSQDAAALRRAAVFGQAFWSSAVEYVGQERVPQERWELLRERDLIHPSTGSQLPGEEELHFKHALLRDVVYEYTLKKDRQVYHRRAAEWLEQVAMDRVAEWAPVIAGHYKEADESVLAARWFIQAGHRARAAYALEAASDYYQQALALLPVPTEDELGLQSYWRQRVVLYQGLGEMYRLEGRFLRAAEAYTGMLAAATAGGDHASESEAWRRAFPSMQDALAAAEHGIPGSKRRLEIDPGMIAALKLNLLGAVYRMLGSDAQADTYMEGTLEHLQETDIVATDAEVAIALYREGLGLAERIGNLGGKLLCLTYLSQAQIELEQYSTAAFQLRQVVQQTEDAGWYGAAEAHRLLAEACLREGNKEQAEASALCALELARAVRRAVFIGRAWRTLGQVAVGVMTDIEVDGAPRSPRVCFERSESVLKQAGLQAERAYSLIAWATYEAEQGDVERAAEMHQRAQNILDRLGIRQAELAAR